MNSTDTKIITPLQLKRELAGVEDIDTVTKILRRAEWNLIMEMKESLFSASFYTEIGDRNHNLISLCLTLLEWVRHFHGGTNQSIAERKLGTHSIDELLKPFDRLRKMVRE